MNDEIEKIQPATRAEQIIVIGIFGVLALYSFYLGKFELGAGFANMLAIYYLSREGV